MTNDISIQMDEINGNLEKFSSNKGQRVDAMLAYIFEIELHYEILRYFFHWIRFFHITENPTHFSSKINIFFLFCLWLMRPIGQLVQKHS